MYQCWRIGEVSGGTSETSVSKIGIESNWSSESTVTQHKLQISWGKSKWVFGGCEMHGKRHWNKFRKYSWENGDGTIDRDHQ